MSKIRIVKIVILLIIIALLVAIGLSLKKSPEKIEGEISPEVQRDLLENSLIIAINDEYKARATYKKVIENFGSVKPFSNIVEAEEKHINSLEKLFEKYELDIPEDNWYEVVEIKDTLQEMCEIGVQAEIENANLYEKVLIPATSNYSDVTKVFKNLMSASRKKHLPAFEKCS